MIKTLGTLIFLFGVTVIACELSGYTPEILKWMTQWGAGVGWGLKVSLVIVGATFYLIAASQE